MRLTSLAALFFNASALLHREGPDPIPPSVMRQRSKIASWQATEMGSQFRAHRPGTEMVSGAFAFATFLHMLNSRMDEAEQILINKNATHLLSTGSGNSKGLAIESHEKTSGEGVFFTSEMSKLCDQHDEFGDKHCVIPWGKTVHALGKINVGDIPVEEGATAEMACFMKFNDEYMQQLLPPEGLPPVKVSCKACGEPCVVDNAFYKTSFAFDPPPCPLDKGIYSWWSQDFPLPTKQIFKQVDFEEYMMFSLIHKNGTKLFDLHLKGYSYREGSGGGWLQKAGDGI